MCPVLSTTLAIPINLFCNVRLTFMVIFQSVESVSHCSYHIHISPSFFALDCKLLRVTTPYKQSSVNPMKVP